MNKREKREKKESGGKKRETTHFTLQQSTQYTFFHATIHAHNYYQKERERECTQRETPFLFRAQTFFSGENGGVVGSAAEEIDGRVVVVIVDGWHGIVCVLCAFFS